MSLAPLTRSLSPTAWDADGEHHRVAVIGGGISGLTCAFDLQRQGVDVAVLEAGDRPGGVIGSERDGDYLIETGPNSVLFKPEFRGLVEDLDLEGDLIRTPMRDQPRHIYKQGIGLQEVPTSLRAFLRTPLLSRGGKLRLLVDPFLFGVPRREITVADFARRHVGREMFEMFIAPFISGVYAGNPETMSLQGALPRMAALVKRGRGSLTRGAIAKMRADRRERRRTGQPRVPSSLCSFDTGLGRLPEALAEALGDSFQPGAEVKSIVLDRGRWRISVDMRDSGAVEMTSDALILATPASTARALIADALPGAAEPLAQIPYIPITVAHLGVPSASMTREARGFGFLVPRGHGLRILGSLYTGAVFEGRAPEGHTLLTVFTGGATDTEAINLSDEELLAVIEHDLRIAQGWNGKRAYERITRYEHALPAYRMGHVERIARLEREARAAAAPIAFAGNYLHGISVVDCIAQAHRVAGEITAALPTRE
ncbi:protoporphyrinogen oxidase [Candidatus Sumerlaeota bacterium]|nr:protoporphyrinogen oxidase [Candidatus Sumerlaeota bacterium]